MAVGQQQHDEMWQEIPQQEKYQDIDFHLPVLGTSEGGAEGHQQPVQEAVGQEQQEIPPQPQLQDSETQGPDVGTATTERGGEGPQEPVQEPVGQQQDVVPASQSQKIVKRPSRPRQWV